MLFLISPSDHLLQQYSFNHITLTLTYYILHFEILAMDIDLDFYQND
jgi:hypothetical protein